MIKYHTTFEATNNLPMLITIGHGENADLIANFKDDGIDVVLSGYVARAIYQPKSKWGTDDWYECPCEIINDTVIAHWGNTYDNGDNAVKLFMHLIKNGKLAYPAIYQISLFETPGFSPSTIEPIPETIDFAQYQLENAPWALSTDIPYSVRSISVDSSYSPSFPYECSTGEIVGITVPSEIVEDYIGIKLPERNPNKGIDFYVTMQNRTNHIVHLGIATPSWYEPYAMRSWETIFEDGLDSLNINAGETACFHFRETGTISTSFASRYQMIIDRAGYISIDTTYSETPRFTEWIPVNYTFDVVWKENLNHWIFNFNGTEVGGSTGEWANPNATNLSFNYNGIQLEANRTRLDVGYVLGSRSDKPLQPMGNYATIDDVDSKPLYTRQVITIPTGTVSYTVNIDDRTEYGIKASDSDLASIMLDIPDPVEGKVLDFIVDIDNTQNSRTLTIHLSHNWFYAYDRFIEEWTTIFDTSAGKYNRFHFRETGLSKTSGANTRPVIYIEKLELFMLGY